MKETPQLEIAAGVYVSHARAGVEGTCETAQVYNG
jgi:hypothetical protein